MPDSLNKSVTLLGEIRKENAIVTIEKIAFEKGQFDEKDKGLEKVLREIRNLDENDIYSWNVGTLVDDVEHNPSIKINVIYPATETHVKKHRKQNRKVVRETPELYEKIVVPYIDSMKGDRIKWVDNILYNGAEADRVVYRDEDEINGFVLLPNMKWDRKTMEVLYLMAIVQRADLASIRDLNSSHLPFLKNIRSEILKAVHESYGVGRDELKLYFHYQPSYYHLHIHVAHVNHEQFDFGRSVLLDNVIDQLELLGIEGYSKSTLTYFIGEGHDLWVNGFRNEREI